MVVNRLDEKAVANARPGSSAYYILENGVSRNSVKGFGLRVFPSGRKSYVVRHRSQPILIGRADIMKLNDARQAARILLLELTANPRVTQHVKTVGDLSRTNLEEVREHRSPKTAEEYARAWTLHLIPFLGAGTKLTSVTPSRLRSLHKAMADKPYAANRVLDYFAAAWTLAERLRWVLPGANPATPHAVERYREESASRALGVEEYQRLFSALRRMEAEGSVTPPAAAACFVLLLTGMRPAELLTAKLSDATLTGERPHIVLTHAKGDRKSRSGKSAARGRTVWLPAEAAEKLRSLDHRRSEWLVPGADPKSHLVSLQKSWRRMFSEAGVAYAPPKTARHSFVSQGVDTVAPERMSELVGHADTTITHQVYRHLTDGGQHAAAEAVAAKIRTPAELKLKIVR